MEEYILELRTKDKLRNVENHNNLCFELISEYQKDNTYITKLKVIIYGSKIDTDIRKFDLEKLLNKNKIEYSLKNI